MPIRPEPEESSHLRAVVALEHKGVHVKEGYRLIVVDKDGVLVSEFQLRESDLADPVAFVAALQQSIEDVEDEES
jgi:hypothetical protein